jgi:hypothetical protein
MGDRPIFLVRPASGDLSDPDCDFQPQRAVICRSSFTHPGLALTLDHKSTLQGGLGDLHSRHLRSGFRRGPEVFRRATPVLSEQSRDQLLGLAPPPLDAVVPILSTENDYDGPLPCRPVLIAQRFDDMWRDIRRQDLEIKSLTDRLAELTDTFAPEIDDFIQNLQEMTENLNILDRRKATKTPKNVAPVDRNDQMWLTFTDRLRLHCECTDLHWASQLYTELEAEFKSANDRLRERLNVDEELELPRLIAKLRAEIEEKRQRIAEMTADFQQRLAEKDAEIQTLQAEYGNPSAAASRSVADFAGVPFRFAKRRFARSAQFPTPPTDA